VFKKKTTTSEEFYALKDVSFTVNPGESIGIIGRNGAGKSTLLKILSSITPPSSGKIITRGRIASLLEVGTGFHPELTGRENVFLNGSILGMRRHEILKNFDAIVDFAGVEKFIDTPLKHYSSGMQLRLAFAVAAFLENEILIIDEVLAVGDAEFQKKCMGKMGEITKNEGRTVLFVSHNTEAIANLCQKVIWLNNGEIIFGGDVLIGLKKYLTTTFTGQTHVVFSENNAFERVGEKNYAQLESITLNRNGKPAGDFYIGDEVEIGLNVLIKKTIKHPEFGVAISNYKGQRIHHLVSSWDTNINELEKGKYLVKLKTDKINLYPSEYKLSCWVKDYSNPSSDDFIEGAITLNIIKNDEQINKQVDAFSQNGGVYLKTKWDIELV
jgi:lipopolysaccharide transport system ATP-binding protein